MRGRSLAAALALAFGATTLAVFVLVGSYLYLALERQIKTQDNLDIVLAARHARRLAQELDTAKDIREHSDRLTSIVLGNEAMSMEVFGPDGNQVIEHNAAATFAAPHKANEAGAASVTSATSGTSGTGATSATGATRATGGTGATSGALIIAANTGAQTHSGFGTHYRGGYLRVDGPRWRADPRHPGRRAVTRRRSGQRTGGAQHERPLAFAGPLP
jgi:hypothetical protein